MKEWRVTASFLYCFCDIDQGYTKDRILLEYGIIERKSGLYLGIHHLTVISLLTRTIRKSNDPLEISQHLLT